MSYGKTSSGIALPAYMDADGAQYVINSGGKHTAAALAGRLWSIASAGAVATTAGTAATWTGLGISNPAASGKDAIIHEFSYATSITVATNSAIGLMVADTTGFADSLTAKKAMTGVGPASVVNCDAGATISASVAIERIYGTLATGISGNAGIQAATINIDGSIILPPGRSVMTYTTNVIAANLLFHFLWEEVDR